MYACEQMMDVTTRMYNRLLFFFLPKILTDSSGANTPSTGLTEYFMGAFVLNLYPTGDDDKFLSLTFETWPGETLDAILIGDWKKKDRRLVGNE